MTHDTTDRAALGRRLRAAREAALLTQRDVEARTGIDQSVLARMEGGQRKVTALEVMRLAAIYGVSAGSILGEEATGLRLTA